MIREERKGANSPSARAAMTLDSPILFCCAADERDCWSSWLKTISCAHKRHQHRFLALPGSRFARTLMRMDSIETPHFALTPSTIVSISAATASLSVRTDWRLREPTTWRSVVWERSMRAKRTSEMPKAACEGGMSQFREGCCA